MALRRTASGQGSVEPVTRDGRTFRTCLIWQVEAAVETSGSKPQPPWVPYYVMHKILAGLLSHFEVAAVVVMAAVVMAALVVALMAVVAQLWGAKEALDVALRLATHLRRRVDAMVRRGEDVWLDFINQEVGVASSGPVPPHPTRPANRRTRM